MNIKKSAMVGKAINRLMETEEATGEQLAIDFNVSPQLISHIKNERRTMQADIAQESIALYDNPEYTMDILYEFSSKFTSPVLRGRFVEQHRMTLEAYAKKEIEEALERIQNVCLAKPPSMIDENERLGVRSMMDELIEARIHIDNLLKQLQKEYKISIMDRIKALLPTWKVKGWIE
ncbi:hypothetical protein [Planomicrobium sp. YIM 101495]|uniref:hypothetical protein n=1 Tax=Planomicrobium sp. YIM 101495 TaxID=2665160 RepID=UPI0012B8EE1A|nr:hypothetical protein [Planomicrobium sp. YIM 101495]MTD30188.1 hypothetical protein [Planomicrobium sp. YIM 101495]